MECTSKASLEPFMAQIAASPADREQCHRFSSPLVIEMIKRVLERYRERPVALRRNDKASVPGSHLLRPGRYARVTIRRGEGEMIMCHWDNGANVKR